MTRNSKPATNDNVTETLASIIQTSLHTDLELNSVNTNIETPYTAFKLIIANEQMSLDNLNKIVRALQFAHISKVKLSTASLLNNLEKWDAEYLWSMLITVPDMDAGITYYEWKVSSTINKELRTAILSVNNNVNLIPFECWSEVESSKTKTDELIQRQWLHIKIDIMRLAALEINHADVNIVANIL